MSADGSSGFAVRLRSRRVQREIDNLPAADYRRVIARIRALRDQPRPPGAEKLFDNVYRVRVGDWRIIYLVDETSLRVDVGAVRRRSERTYRGLGELFT